MRRGVRRASTASDVGEEREDGIDCTAWTREVVSRDRNRAAARDPVGQALRITGELVVGTGDDEDGHGDVVEVVGGARATGLHQRREREAVGANRVGQGSELPTEWVGDRL